jgi:hypothetical protein
MLEEELRRLEGELRMDAEVKEIRRLLANPSYEGARRIIALVCAAPLMEALLKQPAAEPPEAFWGTALGRTVADILVRSKSDDLVTSAEAITLLFPGSQENVKTLQSRVRRLGEAGKIQRFRNPRNTGTNQERWFYSRSDIEVLLQEKRHEHQT